MDPFASFTSRTRSYRHREREELLDGVTCPTERFHTPLGNHPLPETAYEDLFWKKCIFFSTQNYIRPGVYRKELHIQTSI